MSRFQDRCRGAEFSRRTLGQHEVVDVVGEIGLENEAEFEAVLLDAGADNRPVIVDLTNCTHLDSCGLGKLAEARQAGTDITVRAQPQIARLFGIVGLGSMLEP